MIALIKTLCFAVYAFAFWLGVPCAIVFTGMLINSWLGGAWWAGFIIAPICLAEFIGALAFALWEDNPIPDWIMD